MSFVDVFEIRSSKLLRESCNFNCFPSGELLSEHWLPNPHPKVDWMSSCGSCWSMEKTWLIVLRSAEADLNVETRFISLVTWICKHVDDNFSNINSLWFEVCDASILNPNPFDAVFFRCTSLNVLLQVSVNVSKDSNRKYLNWKAEIWSGSWGYCSKQATFQRLLQKCSDIIAGDFVRNMLS